MAELSDKLLFFRVFVPYSIRATLAGQTGEEQSFAQRLNGNDIPNDVIKNFDLDPKKVKKL